MTGNTPLTQQSVAGEKLAEKVAALLDPVEQIVHGKKPVQYPAALRAQMEIMDDDDFLSESVDTSLVRADETPSGELNRAKGATGFNAMPHGLDGRQDNIDAVAHSHNIYNYKVLGRDMHYRLVAREEGMFDRADPVDIAAETDAAILSRGDICALREMLHLMRAKLQRDERVLNTRLIIQNTHKYWAPVIHYLGLESLPCDLKNTLDLHITQFPGAIDTDSAESTIYALRTMGPRALRKPAPSKFDRQMRPHDLVYVASGSAHKPFEIHDAFAAQQALLDVRSLYDRLGIKPTEALEDAHSVEGNNFQKLLSFRKLIMADYNGIVGRLCTSGRGPENTHIVFDDRALEFLDQRIPRTMAFSHAWPLFNPYPHKLMPGAELAAFFNACGRQPVFEEMLFNALNEIREQTGEDADPTIINTACHFIVRLDDLLLPQVPYTATFAKTRSRALTRPRPSGDHAFFAEHYTAPHAFNPVNTPFKDLRTAREIPNYQTSYSEIAMSLKTAGRLLRVDEHRESLSSEFRIAGCPDKLRVGTLHTLFPDINGHGTRHMHRAVNGALNGSCQLMTGRDARRLYDITPYIRPRTLGSQALRCGGEHRRKIEEMLSCLSRFYRDADAFVLTPDNKKLKNVPGIEWLKLLIDYSLKNGKLVSSPYIKPKFFGILDEGDGSWDHGRAIFRHLNKTALVLSYYEHLVKEVENKCQLKEALKEHRFQYVRPGVLEKLCELKEGSREADPALFRVTVYCSAKLGATTQAYQEGMDFTESLAARSFALVQGGGREGIMYATAEGVHRYIRKFKAVAGPNAQPRTHVRSEQCYDTFEREGEWHDETHFGRIHDLIEQRIAHLMNTDAEVLLAGAVGSIQEVAASLLARDWGLAPVADRPFVIVNQVVDGIRVFDPLVAMLTPEDRTRLNIHVVASAAEALPILEAARRSLAQKLAAGEIYVPEKPSSPKTAVSGFQPELTLP